MLVSSSAVGRAAGSRRVLRRFEPPGDRRVSRISQPHRAREQVAFPWLWQRREDVDFRPGAARPPATVRQRGSAAAQDQGHDRHLRLRGGKEGPPGGTAASRGQP